MPITLLPVAARNTADAKVHKTARGVWLQECTVKTESGEIDFENKSRLTLLALL